MFPEPKLSFLVLDYEKPVESRTLLESIKKRVKFEHKVIYLHNGLQSYPQDFLNEGLIDQLIVSRTNDGLGIGTKVLFANCFSRYAIYAQNDQILGRDFIEEEFEYLVAHLGQSTSNDKIVKSISLAGAPCGDGVYSERAHLIETNTYFELEWQFGLPYGGAGKFHDVEWREGYIQKLYAKYDWTHYIYPNMMFIDNGRSANRQNPDGSKWKHFPDTKQLWLVEGPVKEKFVYPYFTDSEWDEVLKTQSWPDGKIPEREVKNSFHYWN